jgi:hypothetical protein
MLRQYFLPIAIALCIFLCGLTYAIAVAKQTGANVEQSTVNTMLCVISSDVSGADKTFRIAFKLRNPSPTDTRNLTLTARFNREHANRIKWSQEPTIENNRECIWHLNILPADKMTSIFGDIVVSRPMEIEFHLEDFERTYPSSFVELGTWGMPNAPNDVRQFSPSDAEGTSENNTEALPSN